MEVATVTLVSHEDGGWAALYIGDQLVTEGEMISPLIFGEAVKNVGRFSFSAVTRPHDWWPNRRAPNKLYENTFYVLAKGVTWELNREGKVDESKFPSAACFKIPSVEAYKRMQEDLRDRVGIFEGLLYLRWVTGKEWDIFASDQNGIWAGVRGPTPELTAKQEEVMISLKWFKGDGGDWGHYA